MGSWVLDAPVVNIYAQSVYLELLDHTGKDQDVVWPSVATIARRAKMGTTAARRSLRQLEDLGMITVETQPSHKSNRYTIVELSDADIARIQDMDENVPTSGDAKLRGSDLGATPRVDPATPRVDPPTPRVAGATPRVDKPVPSNQFQEEPVPGTSSKGAAPRGAERLDQKIEITQEPRTEAETGLHARLKRIAVKGEVSVTLPEDLGRRLAERMTFERTPGEHPLDTEQRRREFDKMRQRHGLGEAKHSMPPMVSLSDLAGDGPQEPLAEDTSTLAAPKFQKLWDTPEAKKTAAKRESRKRQEALEASESAERQNREIVAQDQGQPQQRFLNVGSDGLDRGFLAEMMNYTDPVLLEMERG